MMEDKEAVDMMQRCMHEIEAQRQVIARMRPNAEAYEIIRGIVGMLPKPSEAYGEDLVWILRKRIQELQPKPKADE